MADLYEMDIASLGEKATYVKVTRSLFDLLTSGPTLMVDGLRFLRKGTPEWDAYIAASIRDLEVQMKQKLDKKRIAAFVEDATVRLHTEEVSRVSTPVKCMCYLNTQTPNRRLVWDESKGVVCEISVGKRQVEAFPMYYREGEDPHYFLPDNTNKARITRSFYYDGTLHDALTGFAQNGYSFNVWEIIWNGHLLNDGERTRVAVYEARNHPPIEGVSLDDLLSRQWRQE